jgi:hypothetical protein
MVFRTFALFLISAMAGLAFAQSRALFSVRDFGAVGDGARLDTAAINNAIEACAKSGGGTVYVPAGTYLTGTVILKSNMTLWLASGATLLGSKNLADYPVPEPWAQRMVNFGYGSVKGSDWYKALVRGEDLENVTLLGPGAIDGNRVTNPHGEESLRGPHGVSIEHSHDITIRDVTIKDASNWSLRLDACDRVRIDGYNSNGGWDGINIGGNSTDVIIANCRLFAGDDAIAGGARNLTITNCLLSSAANAFRFRGENTVISNIVIIAPGRVEHVTSHRHNTESGFTGSVVGSFVMSNVTMVGVRSPLWISMGGGRGPANRPAATPRPPTPPTTISISNLTATGVGITPFYISGSPDNPLKSLVLDNVRLSYIGGADEKDSVQHGVTPYSILPWYGFFARNIESIEFRGVHLAFEQKDLRPAMYVENIGSLDLDHFRAQREPNGEPSLMLANVKNVLVDGKELPVQKTQVRGLDVDSANIIAGEPFLTTVAVENTGAEGLGEITLKAGDASLVKSVWLKAGEKANVSFLATPKQAGQQQAQAGDFSKSFTVRPKPAGRPVSAPYSAFTNDKGTIEQLDNGGFYIHDTSDVSTCCFDKADTYSAAYQKAVLPANGTIVARMENADLRGAWAGSNGIMVRNDISQAGQAAGYVVVQCSPASGYYMEWDANGDGHMDGHTEMDGITWWPGWVKLERHSSHFTGYYSKDGSNWTKIGEVDMPSASERMDAGLFSRLSSARFDPMKIEASTAR